MNAALAVLNSMMNGLFHLLLLPFRSLHHWWPMLFISALTALLMLWIFGKVSRQDAIRDVKARVRGNLLGVRLFQHDVGIVLKMQRKILRDTLHYAGLSLVPMFYLLIPVALIIVQLNLYFAVRPLAPGQSALVRVEWHGEAMVPDLKLTADSGVVVETNPVRVPADGQVWWRIRGETPGSHQLTISGEGVDLRKELDVGSAWQAISTLRTNGFWDLLLYPGEAPLEGDSPVSAIEISYPEQDFPLFGWKLHWLVVFFLLSIVFSFAFKGFMGVEL